MEKKMLHAVQNLREKDQHLIFIKIEIHLPQIQEKEEMNHPVLDLASLQEKEN